MVGENPNANANATWYEIGALGNAAVDRYDSKIGAAAAAEGIDPNLLRTAVYLENSRGYYDAPLGSSAGSLRPANIRVSVWGPALGLSRAQLSDPGINLRAGARILSGIQGNLSGSNIRAVGTLYNNLNATTVSDYGARFGAIYSIQPWSLR